MFLNRGIISPSGITARFFHYFCLNARYVILHESTVTATRNTIASYYPLVTPPPYRTFMDME
jgi:hypothetical protein